MTYFSLKFVYSCCSTTSLKTQIKEVQPFFTIKNRVMGSIARHTKCPSFGTIYCSKISNDKNMVDILGPVWKCVIFFLAFAWLITTSAPSQSEREISWILTFPESRLFLNSDWALAWGGCYCVERSALGGARRSANERARIKPVQKSGRTQFNHSQSPKSRPYKIIVKPALIQNV